MIGKTNLKGGNVKIVEVLSTGEYIVEINGKYYKTEEI